MMTSTVLLFSSFATLESYDDVDCFGLSSVDLALVLSIGVKGPSAPSNLNSLLWVLGLVVGPWTCIGAKGPSAPSNLNSLLLGFGLVVGSWTCIGAKGPSAPSNLNSLL